MMFFMAGVDQQRATATPVFIDNPGPDTIDIKGRIGARKGNPEKIIKGAGRKATVIDDHQQRQALLRMVLGQTP